jgi:hypothetical protein
VSAEPAILSCTIRRLPEREQLAAAKTAVEINPANAPLALPERALAFASTGGEGPLPPARLAVLTGKYWGVGGRKLSVSFLDSPNAATRNKILAALNQWSSRANVSFAETSGVGDVRISREASGYWSYLGTDILHIPQGQATMNLQGFTERTSDAEYDRVVTHEAGHTLGFPHEHMRSQIVAQIDREAAIAYFQRTQGWGRSEVLQQVLTPLDERSIRGTPHAEETSIMCYGLPGSIMLDGQPVPGGSRITEEDFAFAASLYPKAVEPNDPDDEPPVRRTMKLSYRRRGEKGMTEVTDVVVINTRPE